MRAFTDLATDLTALGVDMQRAGRLGSLTNAQRFKQVALASTRAAAPAMTLRGRGTRPIKLGVRYVVKDNGSVLVKPTGPYQLIERDTSEHVVPKQLKRITKRTRVRKTLLIPGIGYRKRVNHPGTKGKHPWERAVNAYLPQVDKVYADAVWIALRKFAR